MKIKALFSSLFVVFFVSSISYAQIPTARLQAWYCADSVIQTGGYISQVTDLAGNGYHLLQSNPTAQPMQLGNAVAGHSVIRFDGINDYLMVNFGTTYSQPISIFIVWRIFTQKAQEILDGLDEAHGLIFNYPYNAFIWLRLYAGAVGGYSILYDKAPQMNFTISSLMFNTPSKLYDNGNLMGTYDIGQNSTIGFNVGTRYLHDDRFMDGDILELIFYDTLLTDVDRIQVEQYLMNKYAPPVNLGPDIFENYSLCKKQLSVDSSYSSVVWSTGQDTNIIEVASSGYYWVSVMDMFGRISSDTILVSIPFLQHIPDSTGCLGHPITVTQSLSGPYSYLWSTSDTTDSISVSTPGQYWLEITDTLGCFVRDTFTFSIDSFALTASLGPDRSACRGEILGLAVGQAEAVSYQWSTGSGDPLIQMNAPPGSYADYAVTVTNMRGCVAIDTITVFIRGDVPVVNFTADSVCPGQLMNFQDLSSAPPPSVPVSWSWAFGDGDSASVQNPTHVYGNYGVYPVSLKVVTDSGCFKSLSKNVVVWANPEVYFTPAKGCSGQSILFSDMSSNPLGTNNQWHWDFGQPGAGDTSALQNPQFTFASADTFSVSLTVRSAAGCNASLSREVIIRNSPQPAFSWSHTCEGERTYFADTTHVPAYETIMDRKWTFGDGDTSVYPAPSHLYAAVGTYNVTLWVRSLNGCTAETTLPVSVFSEPAAWIAPGALCLGQASQIFDSSGVYNDSISSWLWTFTPGAGPVTLSSDEHPFYTPADTGDVAVLLEVTTSNGCSDTNSQIISVFPLPVASFQFEPEFGTAPLMLDFDNTSTGSSAWLWTFGDGQTSLLKDPVHTYLNQGVYDILLTAYSPQGCSDQAGAKVYVMMLSRDVAVTATEAVNDNGMLRIEADIMNTGTFRIDQLDLSARFNGSSRIREQWSGDLQPGQSMHYVFNAAISIPAGATVDYACVSAAITGYEPDDNPTNNEQCEVLNDAFVVADPYPNPVSTQLNIDIILPFGDLLQVDVYNEAGKRIATLSDTEAPEGFTKILYDTSPLLAGVYTIQVRFRDKKEEKKFVKM